MYFADAKMMDSFLLYSVLLILLFLTWFIFEKTKSRFRKLPPGPIGIPVLGYAPFVSKDLHKVIEKLNKAYGNVCSMNIASYRVIVVSDYDTAKELLSHPATLSRDPHIYDFIPGKAGFSTMNGKQWIMERRMALQAIRNIGLGKEQWDVIIQEHVVKVVDYIAERKSKPTDLREQLAVSAMHSMTALVMGAKFLNELEDDAMQRIYAANMAVKGEFQNFFISGLFPFLRNFLIKFNIGSFAARKEAVDYFTRLVRNEIEERLSVKDGGDDSIDFIKQYVKNVQKQNGSQGLDGDSNIHPSHVECLLGNIGVFVAASDTAVSSVEWMLYIMSAHPEIQTKVNEEIDNAVGRNLPITWDDRNKLPYTMACIREMLRWVTIMPIFVPRCVSETFEFRGFKIPRGSMIVTNGWCLNRDPKYWDYPNEYRPERFLNIDPGKNVTVEGYAPFSFGKRSCPGDRIAQMITFLYFVGIIQRFEVRTPSGEPPDLTPQYTAIFETKPQDLCFTERK